jgi:hypothetical protein
MDSDKVLVLAASELKEFDEPHAIRALGEYGHQHGTRLTRMAEMTYKKLKQADKLEVQRSNWHA